MLIVTIGWKVSEEGYGPATRLSSSPYFQTDDYLTWKISRKKFQFPIVIYSKILA